MGQDAYPWYRKGKRCWYVYLGGKQVRLHADKATAFKMWHDTITNPSPGGATVADVVKAYLEDATPRLAKSTLKLKRVVLNPLVEKVGHTPAAALDGQAWLDRHPRWGQSRRWLAALTIKAAWRWAARTKPPLIDVNPLASWAVPGPLSRGTETIVSGDDHERLLEDASPCHRDVLAVLYATGMRPCELCALEATHFRSGAGVIVLDVHKTSRKTGKPRVVVLPPAALEVVKRLTDAHPTGPLFQHPNGDGFTVNGLCRWFRRAGRRLGLKVTPYGYRHTLATDALANGVPDAQVAALLGHSNTAMLHKHYSHLTARLQALKEAANRVRPQ